MTNRPPEHFDIDASVVFQLGENLVTDALQALLELIKNSYDADATFCNVTLSTLSRPDLPTLFPEAEGFLIIEDDGSGMSMADIRRGWLTISNSAKRDLKLLGRTTPGGRTPLGDKGLGRLGTQRLGQNIELLTVEEAASEEHHIAFSWANFAGKKSLGEVDIEHSVRPKSRRKGTTLIISDLKDLALWKERGSELLEAGLSRLLSPYAKIPGFDVYTSVDGRDVHLYEITDRLRTASLVRYSLSYENELFAIAGRCRLPFFLPEKGKKERLLFSELVEKDDGDEFYKFVKNLRGAERFKLERPSQRRWFLQFDRRLHLEEIPTPALSEDRIADPGPFGGEVDFFSLGQEAIGAQKTFTESEYKRLVKTLSGIRVYRDGFGVRLSQDWLHLGQQWTGGRSYYGLRPQNTLGFISISARDNQALLEKTDREGFIENAHYGNFYGLLHAFTDFSEDVQEFLRRSWTEFKKEKRRESAQVHIKATPEDLTAQVSSILARATSYRTSLSTAAKRINYSVGAATKVLDQVSSGQLNGSAAQERISSGLSLLVKEIESAEKAIEDVEAYLVELEKFEAVAQVIGDQIESLRERISQVYEVISLGLTAEALSHEIENVTSQLARRNDQIIRYLGSRGPRDSKLVEFTQYVKSAITGLRKQLTYLSPSLGYVREKREDIDMPSFLSDVYKHHLPRLSDSRISLAINRRSSAKFVVSMNRGKLTQIMDNLILNSKYWLEEDLRLKRIAQGRISIEMDKPYIRVSDNGRGVDPVLEDSIFEPFVTAKGKGQGRGLGLYIVQQLLEVEGCSISLLPDRNKYDRRVTFQIDLRNVLVD